MRASSQPSPTCCKRCSTPIIKRMASKKQKPGWAQPTLEGYLQRRNQTLNEWVIENQLGSLMHLRKKCEEMGMTPPASVPWDTPWLGYRPKPPPPQPAPAPEPVPVVAKTEEVPAAAPKKKKKQVEEGSSVRTMLHEMQEDAPKDADS